MASRHPIPPFQGTTHRTEPTDHSLNADFVEQITVTRNMIMECFDRSYQALKNRQDILNSLVDQIENEYNFKMQEMRDLVGALEVQRRNCGNLTAARLERIRQEMMAAIDREIAELTADIDSRIEFEWDCLFETDIEQLGNVKLNGQTDISTIRTFSPNVKPVVPDYKVKHLPTIHCCKKSNEQKAPGEMSGPRCIAVHYKTGHIYIADQNHDRVQVFASNGDYLFMFSEGMVRPLGMSISQDRVFVTQFAGHTLNKYDMKGILIKSVGSKGSGDAQFESPYGLSASDRTNYVYVCDYNNDRVQIFTEDLDFLSIFGIGQFIHPCDIKVVRDRLLVLDQSDPCMFVFDLNHILTTRLIARGAGKQTEGAISFDIDREFNFIMSDYARHCVYIFNHAGEPIHMFGKHGTSLGEFISPWGVALDNTGRIIVACHKTTGCVQFF